MEVLPWQNKHFENMKYEIASQKVNLKQGYNGDLAARTLVGL